MIVAGDRAELGICAQILQISFDHRRAAGKRLHESVLPLYEAIHHLIHGDRLRQR